MRDPEKKDRRSFSHRLYERIGVNVSLKAIDAFIAVLVAVILIALGVGIFYR